MLPYILFLSISLFCIYFFDVKGQKKGAGFFYAVLLLYAILLSGLSYRIGTDIYNYSSSYDELPDMSEFKWEQWFDYNYQPFYVLLCSVSRSISHDFYILHLFQSAIVCTVMFAFIHWRTKYHFTGLFVFITIAYIYFCFDILRESLAIVFVSFGYKYMEAGKYTRFYLFVCIAFMFHLSAIIAILFPVMQRLRFDKSFLFALGCMLVLLSLLESFSEYIFFYEKIYNKFSQYSEVESYNINWYIGGFIRQTVIPFLILCFLKRKFSRVPYEWALCFYVLCSIGMIKYNIIFERPLNYVLPFVILSVTEMLGKYLRGFSICKVWVISLFLMFCAARNITYWRDGGWRILYPYSSIFTKKVDAMRENWLYDFWRH